MMGMVRADRHQSLEDKESKKKRKDSLSSSDEEKRYQLGTGEK